MDSFIYILHMLGSNINNHNIAMQPGQNFVKSPLLMAYRRKSLELNHGACLRQEEKSFSGVYLSCFLHYNSKVSEGKLFSLLLHDNDLNKDCLFS